ncbi:hypothetical protein ALC62_09523, partial [Cyphomyrmex costatus]
YYRHYHVTLPSLSVVPLAATSFNLLSRIQTTWETALVYSAKPFRIEIVLYIIYYRCSGVPFREFRKTQEAIIPRRKNILLGHTEENSLAHSFSANEVNFEALDTSRLTYEGCSAAKLTEEQQTFVNSITFYFSSMATPQMCLAHLHLISGKTDGWSGNYQE